jgi:putative photosynthetic complex assembly protein
MSTGFIEAGKPGAPRKGAAERPVLTPALVRLMAGLCLAALALAAFGRYTGIGVQKLPQAPAAETRELLFLDAGAGRIEVLDAADRSLLRLVKPGEGGFLRTVMRGLAHERMARGGDSATPFRLTLRTDGRLIIADPMTLREVILDSFGKPNRDDFANLLHGRAAVGHKVEATAAGAARETRGDNK